MTQRAGAAAPPPAAGSATASPAVSPRRYPCLRVVSDAEDGKQYRLDIKSGEWNAVTMGLLKKALVDKCGIPFEEQVLSLRGVVLRDDDTCPSLGLGADEELHLSRKAPNQPRAVEVQYFTDVIRDAMDSFDSAVAAAADEPGGIAALSGAERERLIKELRRTVRGAERRAAEFERELAAVKGAADRYGAVLTQCRRSVKERADRLAALEAGGGELLLSRGGAPALPPALDAFFCRFTQVYRELVALQALLRQARAAAVPDGGSCDALSRGAAELCVAVRRLRSEVGAAASAAGEANGDAAVMVAATEDTAQRLRNLLRDFGDFTAGFTRGVPSDVDAGVLRETLAEGGPPPGPPAAPLREPGSPPRASPAAQPRQSHAPAPAAPAAPPTAAAPPPPPPPPPAGDASPKQAAQQNGGQPHPAVCSAVVEALEAGDLWLARLALFYSRYNPEKVSTVARILPEWRGKEDELFSTLFEKYKVDEEQQKGLHQEVVAMAAQRGIDATAPSDSVDQSGGGCTLM
eukprot:TRINITY_DN8444_c0_g1_i1.p1 TRINITY_DN8444_c0_g1~~TRINITY_DN8444_c0_g1_i1.p1  ORF type:complete len:520 (+),score=152.77 TRINITY_DN8444_c0_g1_i1:161-1720(+)